MTRINEIVSGNRYEVVVADDTYLLWDSTRQMLIATSHNENELIIYAQKRNMIMGDAVVMG